MAVCDFIILSLWIFLVNLFVEIISLSFKTRLGFDFRGTAIALPVLALMDLIAIIATFKLRSRQKVSKKLIVGLFCMVFLVKFGIVVMLIVVNGHVLTAHWILMPYNSRQSHYKEVPRWEIFMEQELRFGLDLARLAVHTEK